MPARASVPSRDTHQVSINPVEAITSITAMLGQASRSKVGRIGASSSMRVRGSSGRASVGVAGTAGAVPRSSRSNWAASLSSCSAIRSRDSQILGLPARSDISRYQAASSRNLIVSRGLLPVWGRAIGGTG